MNNQGEAELIAVLTAILVAPLPRNEVSVSTISETVTLAKHILETSLGRVEREGVARLDVPA